jgi:hypothetical protein
MTDAFIPPAPERADHRRAALEDALARLQTRIEATKEYEARKRAENDDRVGIEHACGTMTGLLVARDMLKAMIGPMRNA